DNLMRVFGGEGIKNMMSGLMTRSGLGEDEPIENRMITRSLESAQEKIEGFNFDARKHVLEFDDVLNFQRKIMYARRRAILLGDDSAVHAYIDEIVGHASPEERAEIEAKIAGADAEFMKSLRQVILQTIDMFWVDHLEMMDYLRSSVNLRAYGQRDPLVEYKKEGLKLFKDMELSTGLEVIKIITQVQPQKIFFEAPQKLVETREGAQAVTQESKVSSDTRGDKVGRNDLCPCGSGKKFKKCGEIGTDEHNKLMAQK
ncbi:MAG: preprotein translocase subunit SecA, partial [Patescibacteria group bacterium]|nr:preprotein translocase subunit SecA [Patescibacteria group bacterium]